LFGIQLWGWSRFSTRCGEPTLRLGWTWSERFTTIFSSSAFLRRPHKFGQICFKFLTLLSNFKTWNADCKRIRNLKSAINKKYAEEISRWITFKRWELFAHRYLKFIFVFNVILFWLWPYVLWPLIKVHKYAETIWGDTVCIIESISTKFYKRDLYFEYSNERIWLDKVWSIEKVTILTLSFWLYYWFFGKIYHSVYFSCQFWKIAFHGFTSFCQFC
jgi:hypothetical protein